MQKNIVETIGNTPLIEISEISPNSAKIFAKLESSNLQNANLTGANLSGAILDGANLKDSNLSKAIFLTLS